MRSNRSVLWLVTLILAFGMCQGGEARTKKNNKRAKKYYPPLTHPVVLWSRTLSTSVDSAERKKAAFKLSAYTQPIYQDEVVRTLITCTKDSDVEVKVLCTKALGRAGSGAAKDRIRKTLVDLYQEDASLRNTIVRTFIVRKESSPEVHYALLESARASKSPDDVLVLLNYFESYGTGSEKFVEGLVEIYNANDNLKVKRAVVKSLGERAKGQEKVIEILASCSESKDTPLALTCLSGLQLQGTKDKRTWTAVEKSILSDDPDMIDASLDVINALPETTNSKLSSRLVAIIEEYEDPQMLEKGILALGVSGDHGEPIVKVLLKSLESKDSEDSTRVAAALVLGKQADQFPEKPRELLAMCSSGGSQSLRTACTLGLKELEARKMATKKEAPAAKTQQ